ncbi:cysteine-rich repeat secretory protein 55 [Typha angustifolia]|uniref:cysteine-rich repeat secretory protein 55 n=1 Tax=Typha angustifolia TaxID=59011 RepID=UPI003C2EABC5
MAPLVYHLLLLSLLLPLCLAADPNGQYCSDSYNGGQIRSNINYVLSDLVAKASVGGGFAISSYGKGNNTIYGLAQCRGDVSEGDCSTCLTDAAKQLPLVCPGKSDARIWYDYCFMRYDTDNFVGQSDTSYALILINVENATNPEAFDKAVGKLMRKVEADAVVPGNGGLGREEAKFTPYITIYGLAQCTRDLQPLTCAQCLSAAVELFPDYCRFRKGCRVLYSSCTVRYEIYPFYFPLDGVVTSQGEYSKFIWHP